MMILNRTAFSSRNRRPMGTVSAEVLSSMAGRIWKKRIMGYIPDRRGQDRLSCAESRVWQFYMLSPLFFSFSKKNVSVEKCVIHA